MATAPRTNVKAAATAEPLNIPRGFGKHDNVMAPEAGATSNATAPSTSFAAGSTAPSTSFAESHRAAPSNASTSFTAGTTTAPRRNKNQNFLNVEAGESNATIAPSTATAAAAETAAPADTSASASSFSRSSATAFEDNDFNAAFNKRDLHRRGNYLYFGFSRSNVGEYLVDERGMSLYMFAKDTRDVSTCYDDCAVAWPPVLLPESYRFDFFQRFNYMDDDLLGTLTRTDGKVQMTFNHFPLYYYAQDKVPGDILGHGISGFGARWFLLGSDGKPIESSLSS